MYEWKIKNGTSSFPDKHQILELFDRKLILHAIVFIVKAINQMNDYPGNLASSIPARTVWTSNFPASSCSITCSWFAWCFFTYTSVGYPLAATLKIEKQTMVSEVSPVIFKSDVKSQVQELLMVINIYLAHEEELWLMDNRKRIADETANLVIVPLQPFSLPYVMPLGCILCTSAPTILLLCLEHKYEDLHWI